MPHSTVLQSTTSARQCSLVGTIVTETLFWFLRIAKPSQTLHLVSGVCVEFISDGFLCSVDRLVSLFYGCAAFDRL